MPEKLDNANWIELSQCEPDQDSDNSTSQETGSGVDDGLVNDIPEDVKLDELPLYGVDCILELDYISPGVKDWHHVACNTQFHPRYISNIDIRTIEQDNGNSRTRALISKLCTHDVSLKTFVDVLQELRRYDVANGIYTWYKNRG
ncbi:hypothetical protein OS493_031637 [Desmophyllum pertusum]|uniref:Uncharacterized protein n=1 Tax=Desmophyllum pertusum TaxID=174260 RepID=A0A9X0CD41_9CNID|nr:hypothetical protein OS493_031637 [Desmophyllum pertusum]